MVRENDIVRHSELAEHEQQADEVVSPIKTSQYGVRPLIFVDLREQVLNLYSQFSSK